MSLPNAEASSSKHKERKHKHKSKDKKKKEHKSKHAKLPKAERGVDGPFKHRVQRMRLSVPPKYASGWLEGVKETLDGMLMRYVGQMGGVLLAHWEHEIMDDTVKLINECPFGVCEVQFQSIVWAPREGQVLYGTHSLSSPSHLSLLFAKTFNVSIPLQHIPQDKFEFEHTDAPEDEAELSSDEEDDDLDARAVHEVGRWKEKGTGKLLGGNGERVQFTVIGLQVTNQMLSLTGSLLDDPSNPPPLPKASTASVREPSFSPDLPEPPTKMAKVARKPKQVAAALVIPEVDTSGMTARELKKHRKDMEKAKRDARKARKDGEDEDEDVKDDEPAPSLKRKADGEEPDRRKKHKGGA